MGQVLRLDDDTHAIAYKMSEGNPGALSVIVALLKDPLGVGVILRLDAAGIRGPAIWVGYNDHCKRDLDVFKDCVRDGDPEMEDVIRRAGYAVDVS